MKNTFKNQVLILVIWVIGFASCGKNGAGTTQNFTLPIITTDTVTAITQTTSQSGGVIISNGGAAIITSGVCWSTSQNPTVNNNVTTDGSTTGSFVSKLTSLTMGTTYYLRAYATNSVGTAYGNQVSFTTQQNVIKLPKVITTSSVTNLTSNSATYGGNVTDNGGSPILARGVCWSTTTHPTVAISAKTNDGTGTGSFTSTLTGLNASTAYYFRAYATNSAGTNYGDEYTFTTLQVSGLPILTTLSVSYITGKSCVSGGLITSEGATLVTSRGVCWSTSQNPTINLSTITSNGTGTGSFLSNIKNLNYNTTYYIRAYATNAIGTAYGNSISFTTAPPITDVDGNIYDTVRIGTQIWFVQNLATTKYSNGDPLPNVTDNMQWIGLNSGAYCNGNNDPNYAVTYGRIYNLYAVQDSRNLCPVGFHVATNFDWNTMKNYLEPNSYSGPCSAALKSTTWGIGIGSNGTNTSGFTALPAVVRSGIGTGNFTGNGTASWWGASATIPYAWSPIHWSLTNDNKTDLLNVNFNNDANEGNSVRCIKN